MTTCILTDSSVTFSRATFTGNPLVKVVQFGIKKSPTAQLESPSVEQFTQTYTHLGRDYDNILVAIMSSALSPAAENAAQAASSYGGGALVQVIDTQHTGVGLGLLVEMASQAAAAGKSLHEIEQSVRATIPHIYTLFCIPELEHLAQAGFLAYSQAMVAEMLGLFPIFMLEEGHLSPLEKVRTQRHLIESFQEFMEEFDSPRHIAIIKGNDNHLRTRPVRQYINELFPDTPFSEHTLNTTLTALFGAQAIGLTVMDSAKGSRK